MHLPVVSLPFAEQGHSLNTLLGATIAKVSFRAFHLGNQKLGLRKSLNLGVL